MATFTDRMGLRKPSPETSPGAGDGDFTNWVTDLNENWEVIDEFMGFSECTSLTRPAVVWAGLCIYETDTDKTYVSNGASPASASWSEIPNGNTEVNATTANLTGAATATDTVLVSTLSDELNDRFVVDADGTMWWGNGTDDLDVRLYRSAANALTTSGTFHVAQDLTAPSTQITGTYDIVTDTESTHLRLNLSGEEDYRVALSSTGRFSFGEGTSPADVDVYWNTETERVSVGGDLIVLGDLEATGIGKTRFVYKTVDTTRDTMVISNDPELTLPVDANATYEVEMWISHQASSGLTDNINTNWSAPASADGYKSVFGSTSVDADHTSRFDTRARTGIHFFSTEVEHEVLGGDTQISWQRGILVMGASSGTLAFQWAKKEDDEAGTMTVRADSYMKVTRVL